MNKRLVYLIILTCISTAIAVGITSLFDHFLLKGICYALVIFLVLVVWNKVVIGNEIKKVVQTINSSKNTTPSTEVKPAGKDALDELNEEVKLWAEDRKAEVERLKKLETYRREYLGNVSHELKTPIFNIQGYILTLLDGGLDDPTINKDYLQRAERSVERMISIIDDLESITQLEAGELQLDPERFDIAALSNDIIRAQEMKANQKGIMVTLQAVADKPIWVYADKFRVRQVLTNLVVNSIKYGKEYGETKIRFSDVGENILIEISDNGIGIDKQHLPRLFERFYRVDKSRSRDIGGTGLGLAIVKHIIEAHQQVIHVMSTPGAGSVFSFTLKKC